MRLASRMTALMVVAGVMGVAACNENEPSGPPVEAPLECGAPGAPAEACELPLEEQASFRIELVSTSCTADGNKVILVAPVLEELTDNACDEDAGESWNFPGPYAAGTALNFKIESFELASPPSLRATGTYPVWTLTFEDGGDSDFNDIILRVTATPVP
jgi:hypothetical protein